MRYSTLAVDYDGTLARHGIVHESTIAALERLRATGRRLILVTGRQLPDLFNLFTSTHLFDSIVAENGAVLYNPADHTEHVLAQPPPDQLVDALRNRGVSPLSVGRVVVATATPHEATVLGTIQELGLGHQVIFNKGQIMILPPGVNKGFGFAAALRELRLSPRNAVAMGDAENDYSLLALAECAVAVNNALPMLKEHADLVTKGEDGDGVSEVIERLIATDLAEIAGTLHRHDIPLGRTGDGSPLTLPAYGSNVLIAGSSGSGKSTVLAGILERIGDVGYQYCAIDPEGDHDVLPSGMAMGGPTQIPEVDDVVTMLERTGLNAVVNLLGVELGDRPAWFARFSAALARLRERSGRPHWIAIDEAHHLLPAWQTESFPTLIPMQDQTIYTTVDPSHLAPDVLAQIDIAILTGTDSTETLARFCESLGESVPDSCEQPTGKGEALVWFRRTEPTPTCVRMIPTREKHRRHQRKYAQGTIDPAHSFYFRRADGASPSVASNLQQFLELAEAIDDETWLYHLNRGDFSQWFGEVIRNPELAMEARRGEALLASASAESLAIIRRAIKSRYTLPA